MSERQTDPRTVSFRGKRYPPDQIDDRLLSELYHAYTKSLLKGVHTEEDQDLSFTWSYDVPLETPNAKDTPS